MTPIPAETFMHNTIQISQNWGVLWASFKWTCPDVIIAFVVEGGVQPSGFQPAGGTR